MGFESSKLLSGPNGKARSALKRRRNSPFPRQPLSGPGQELFFVRVYAYAPRCLPSPAACRIGARCESQSRSGWRGGAISIGA